MLLSGVWVHIIYARVWSVGVYGCSVLQENAERLIKNIYFQSTVFVTCGVVAYFLLAHMRINIYIYHIYPQQLSWILLWWAWTRHVADRSLWLLDFLCVFGVLGVVCLWSWLWSCAVITRYANLPKIPHVLCMHGRLHSWHAMATAATSASGAAATQPTTTTTSTTT